MPNILNFLTNSLSIAIIWPIGFVFFEVIINELFKDHNRVGQRKYKVCYKFLDDQQANIDRFVFPLSILELYTLLHKKKKALDSIDIAVLPFGLLDISFGIDLCIGAISTSFTNLIMISRSFSHENSETLSSQVIYFFVQFVVLILVINFLKAWKDREDNNSFRIFVIQASNCLGLFSIGLSLFILGDIIP